MRGAGATVVARVRARWLDGVMGSVELEGEPSRRQALARRIGQLVDLALEEDLGSGDVTAEYFVEAGTQARSRVVARRPGVLAGMAAAAAVAARFDRLDWRPRLEDGAALEAGDVVAEISGEARQLLGAERTLLNFLQRLSGIATATRRCVEAVAGTDCAILDTRKTLPGWRLLEKAAVRAGGGANHRLGLFDRAMVKDNHLLAGAGRERALEDAVARFRRERPELPVELEADSLGQVRRFLEIEGVAWILLDNMDDATMTEAVALRDAAAARTGRRVRLEGSGTMTRERLPRAAATGIDAISLGALTHSVTALDLGLDFD